MYNNGKNITPTPGRFEGQHYVTRIPVNGGWHDAADLTQGVGNTARAIISMLDLANSVKTRNPDLYDRLLEESRWGLNWLLGTRFGDGYRDGGMIVGIWTDNVIGTKDDMETPAKNDPSDNFISSITTSMAVPFYASIDPVFSKWCKKSAIFPKPLNPMKYYLQLYISSTMRISVGSIMKGHGLAFHPWKSLMPRLKMAFLLEMTSICDVSP